MPETAYKILVRITKLAIYLVPIVILLFIFDNNFVPLGKLVINYDVNKQESPLIRNFASKEPDKIIGFREEIDDYYQQINHTPVYFDVNLPRLFPKATIKIKYGKPDNQPFFRLGIKQSNDAYLFKNLGFFDLVSYLSQDWEVLFQDDFILAQRKDNPEENIYYKKFNSVDQFLADLPDPDEVLSINYQLIRETKLKGYQSSDNQVIVDHSLRGSHQMYTYLENEDLDITFDFQDINRHAGADDINISIYHKEQLVHEQIVPDDGNTKANGLASEMVTVPIALDFPEAGIYKIKISALTDDLFIKKITSQSEKLVFDNLYLAESSEYSDSLPNMATQPITVYTQTDQIIANTPHQQGLQTITINGYPLAISEVHQDFPGLADNSQLNSIYSPASDIKLQSDGYFAFDQNSYFNPDDYLEQYRSIAYIDLTERLEGFNYVFGHYNEPKKEGKWFVATVEVEVPELYIDEESLSASFILDFPGLSENSRQFEIADLEITWQKDPISVSNLWSKITNNI